jgi:hypothetical protein
MNRESPPGSASSESPLAVGRRAAEELADALARADCKLPSLNGGFPVMGQPYVNLGGASAAEVFRLAAWIRERT